MTERRYHPKHRFVVAGWTLIWLGTILVVMPEDSAAQTGVLLWVVGMVAHAAVVARWLITAPVRAC